MRGRKPKPQYLSLVDGRIPKRERKSKRDSGNGQVTVPRVLPTAPPHLSEGARQWWGWYSAMLDRRGVLTEEHGPALEQLCELYQELIELRAAIRVSGRTYETTNKAGDIMIRPHPLCAMLADTDRRFRGWESEFGLTPASRPRVPGETPSAPSDPAEAYF